MYKPFTELNVDRVIEKQKEKDKNFAATYEALGKEC
jgi:hypothetical protein